MSTRPAHCCEYDHLGLGFSIAFAQVTEARPHAHAVIFVFVSVLGDFVLV